MDVTERHFGYALAFFAVAATLGVTLATAHGLGLSRIGSIPITDVVASHAVFAVFGAILTTIVGAIYQLAAMFTQTELTLATARFQMAEELLYPFGVMVLGLSPFVEAGIAASAGFASLTIGLFCVGVVVLSHLSRSHVEANPMLRRYVIVGIVMMLWPAVVFPVKVGARLPLVTPFGGPGRAHLLFVGVVGVTVLGTLYHVVPFIIWIHRYSDDIGRKPVPMIDDLYISSIASIDFASLVVGIPTLVAGLTFSWPSAAGLGAGTVAFAAVLTIGNLTLTVLRHQYGVDPPAFVPGGPERVREK